MSERITDRIIDLAVEKGAEFAQRALWNTAKVNTIASVFGIGTTTVSLTMIIAKHAPEIAKATRAIADRLVRAFPNR